MFDHVTLRVGDFRAAAPVFAEVLEALDIEQTTSTPQLAVWGNFAITELDRDHPIAQRIHVAFTAPTPAHVERFAQAAGGACFADDGPARMVSYVDSYYSASFKDAAENTFEAVHRDGERPRGNVDHVAIRVRDAAIATAFYATIGPAAGLKIWRQSADRATFSLGALDGSLLVIAGEATRNAHIAFSGDDAAVRRFHADATAAGYRSNGEPGERPRYHEGYHAAYVFDPDGNNIEVVNQHLA
jgi:catechol 2,3-dioxygenase-like lactoylglutathione lyase family enzyme